MLADKCPSGNAVTGLGDFSLLLQHTAAAAAAVQKCINSNTAAAQHQIFSNASI
jgi:hypothetical protein